MRLALGLIGLTTFFITGVCGQIGNCNRTYFAQGAALCQRKAVENLVSVQGATCESEYSKQTNCITKHVQVCLHGTQYSGFWTIVVDLLNHIVMNCGTVSGTVNQLLLNLLNCPSAGGAFTRTKNCWNDFAQTVKVNKADPTLCRVYAEAKQCVANITNSECPVINMVADHCNPFCANRTDDHRPCPATKVSLVCERQFYFLKKKICEKRFIDSMAKNDGDCGVEIPKLRSCLKDSFKGCFDPSVDYALLDQLTDGILSTSSAGRLFCNVAPLNTSTMPPLLRDVVTCNANFSSEANDCTQEFKEEYIKKTGDLCRTFQTATSCLYKIQESHCNHTRPVLQILGNDSYNPFTCESKPTTKPAAHSLGPVKNPWLWSISVCILFCTVYNYLH